MRYYYYGFIIKYHSCTGMYCIVYSKLSLVYSIFIALNSFSFLFFSNNMLARQSFEARSVLLPNYFLTIESDWGPKQ